MLSLPVISVKAGPVDQQQRAKITTADTTTNTFTYPRKKLKAIVSVPAADLHKQSQTMVNALAHDIRNPLTNIRLSLDLIAAEGMDDKMEKYFTIINRNTQRITELITTMLFSFNSTNERVSHHSITQLLDESLEMAKDRIDLQKVSVEKHYQNDCYIEKLKDPVIKIAFLNIINNAIESMSETKGILKIMTSSNNGKNNVTIEDNGTGISPANLKKLFVPFFTTKPMGMGVGLSSTLRILQSQQAIVKVESEVGKGTRFIITF